MASSTSSPPLHGGNEDIYGDTEQLAEPWLGAKTQKRKDVFLVADRGETSDGGLISEVFEAQVQAVFAWLPRHGDGITLLLEPRNITKSEENPDGMDLTLTDVEEATIRTCWSLKKGSGRYM